MKRSLYAFVAIFIHSPAHADPTNDSILGTYELKMGKPGNSITIRLDCENESNCNFTTISQWKNNPPVQDKQALRNVRPVVNLNQATNALKYAIKQQGHHFKNEEYAESMSKLRPVLSSNPTIDKCWDLNFPEPEYMLICTLTNAPAESPPIYLFGTLMASCGEAFCRYVINPMSRIKQS